MTLKDLLFQQFRHPPNPDTWLPADHISRQRWQEAVEAVVEELRAATGRPAFGVTEAEISVHFHRPLGRLAKLLAKKLEFT